MRRVLLAIVVTVMVTLALAPAGAEPSDREALLASGNLYSLEGIPVSGARVTAYIVDESNIEKEIIWSPIATTSTGKGGSFEIRVDPETSKGSVDESGQIRVAFIATDGTSTTMFEEGFLASEAIDGRWIVFTDEASQESPVSKSVPGRVPLEPDEYQQPQLRSEGDISREARSETEGAFEPTQVDRTDPVLGEQWIKAKRGNRTLGRAAGSEGLSLELAMDTRPAAIAARTSAPDQQACIDRYYGEIWTWELQWRNEWDSWEWVSTGLVRTRWSGAGVTLETKAQTKASILLRFGTSYGGTLGYSQENGEGWGTYFQFPSWRRQEPRLQAQFGDFRLYCKDVYNPGQEALWTNITQTKMITWTGGTQKYNTNRDFYCPANSWRRTPHQSTIWVTRWETRYMTAGVFLKGFSLSSKQSTNSNFKNEHYYPERKFYLCGNDNYAIYADHAKEV